MNEEQIRKNAIDFIRATKEKNYYTVSDYTDEQILYFYEYEFNLLAQFTTKATKELQDRVKDLEWQLQEVAKDNDYYQKKNEILERRIVRAKECMKKLLYVVESEHLNCKGLIQNAEDFIHNRMCPLRKQGQHCITKEPCIMCDRS